MAEMNDRLKLEVDRAIRENQNSNARTEEDKKAMVQGWITTAQAWRTRASVDAETLARTGGSMLVPDAPLGGSVKRRRDFLERSKENGSARKKTATSQRGEPSTTPVHSAPTPASVSFPERGVCVGRPAKPSRTSAPGSIPRLQLREVEEKEVKEKEESAAKAEMDLARYIATETVKDPRFNTGTLSDRARKAKQ